MRVLEPGATLAADSRSATRADRVLAALQHFARNGIVCELPSTIARWLGASVDTVQRGIRDLLDDGRLEQTPMRSGKATAYRLVESPQSSTASPQAITAGGPPTGAPACAAAAPQACPYCLDAGFLVVGTRRVEYLRYFDAFGRRCATRDRNGRVEQGAYDVDEYGPCPFCEVGRRQEFPSEPKTQAEAVRRISPAWGAEGFWRGRDTSHLQRAVEVPA